MTQNLYNYYASLVHLVTDKKQRASVNEFLSYTPYYFPEPIDFKSVVPCVPEQFNLPSKETVIQCDVHLDNDRACFLVMLNEANGGITMYRAVGNSIAAHLIGNFVKASDGYLDLSLWRMEEDQPRRLHGFKPHNRLPSDLESIYSVMVNRLLLYINRLAPYSRTLVLPRPDRRRAARSLGYPLKATTEIIISQHPQAPIRARTWQGGHKCLHEVKGHVRIYHRGTPQELMVWVKPHDRGDPMYGVKKTKYKVETDRGER